MPNNQRSTSPIPLLQDADFLRNSRRYPPMAPRTPPPSPADSRASSPSPGSPNAPGPTTPGDTIRPAPRTPFQEPPLPARFPSPNLETDAANTMQIITGMATKHSKEILEEAEFEANWIEEEIQKLRDEVDAQIKELKDEFQKKTREPQENLKRLRALVVAQKRILGVMERWEEKGLFSD
ncbi:hypothetical protein NW752_009516 [Fusarium irregulare]|uniref:Uncharacterized protein n=1 Tax=Fusarium irregulare TaxID=2494466 RepID=A0A9W8PG00_9HYPO|nr:hypothetical protein NW766_011552 [Fusarium irregulare]KAJ4009217.1 hypothetical protein NW752_009516 [Fusarium irregulare]